MTASNLLQGLKQHTVLLADTKEALETDTVSSSAVVNFSLLSHVFSDTSAWSHLVNACEKGVSYAMQESPGDKAAAMDRAMLNVGLHLKGTVGGRLVHEVDPRLADDAVALERRARRLVALYGEHGVQPSKLLLQLPGTFDGIEAAARLEADGVQTEVSGVYSFAQAVKAARARVAVIIINIARINAWYDKNPGAIRDPQGPRQDAGGDVDTNVGVRTATAAYTYAQQQGGATKLVITGLKSKAEAVQLSGADYMVLSAAVKAELECESTLDGYNDGLHARDTVAANGMPVLNRDMALAFEFRPRDIDVDVDDEQRFGEALGPAGVELLRTQVARGAEGAERVDAYLGSLCISRE